MTICCEIAWFEFPFVFPVFPFVFAGYSYSTYFLKYRRYWRYDEALGKADNGYPRIFDVDWMGCAVGSLEDLEGSEADDGQYAVVGASGTTEKNHNSAISYKLNIILTSVLLISSAFFLSM